MCLGGIYRESVFMPLTFLLLCRMKIFMECGREGWWRRLAVLEMGRWAKRFFPFLFVAFSCGQYRIIVAIFLVGDGGGRGGR